MHSKLLVQLSNMFYLQRMYDQSSFHHHFILEWVKGSGVLLYSRKNSRCFWQWTLFQKDTYLYLVSKIRNVNLWTPPTGNCLWGQATPPSAVETIDVAIKSCHSIKIALFWSVLHCCCMQTLALHIGCRFENKLK